LKIIPLIIVSIVLLSAFAYLAFGYVNLQKTVSTLNSELSGELELSREKLDRTYENLNLIASGTNQLRMQNGLPPLNIDYGNEPDEDENIDPQLVEEQKKDVFYDALNYLIRVNDEYESRARFDADVMTSRIEKELKSKGYSIQYNSTLSGDISYLNKVIMTFNIVSDSESYGTDSYGNKYLLKDEEDIINALESYERIKMSIQEKSEKFKENLTQIPYRKDLQSLINEKTINFKITQEEERYTLLIRLSDYVVKTRAGVILSRGELFLEDRIFSDWESFENALISYLNSLDGRTDREILDEEVESLILSMVKESSFLNYLSENNLTLSPVLRQSEESDYIHWDFLNSQGKRVGSFALLKGFGELYLLDGDDVVLKSFRNLTDNHVSIIGDSSWSGEEIKDIDYIQTTAEEETFLVVGSHERNADTIIIVHANSNSHEIKMISIPRDLWFKNRKLNSVYRYYGIDALADTVSELTGLTINKYMAIDMYAFIDVINIMGGIDVVLDEALVDPTYHIKENGQWTTLNYPAGPQHLDGLGALRVARSRHSTNDYSRSRRQQLIIGAIFDKLSSLGISDIDKLAEFVQAGLKYTETNITAGSLVMDLMKYKNSKIDSNNVIDATNVLYESYSNLYRLSPQEQAAALEDDDYYLGAWIVLPKEGNYNLIKWRIQEIINN
jgi:LCP family protein required for cell wall assembly